MFQALFLKQVLKHRSLATYVILLIVISTLWLQLRTQRAEAVGLHKQVAGLRVVVAVKPRVVIEYKTRWRKKRTEAPTRKTTTTTTKPSGEIVKVEEIISGLVVVEEIKTDDGAREEKPICPVYIGDAAASLRRRRWLVGGSFSPGSAESTRLNAGVTLLDRVDLIYSFAPRATGSRGLHHIGANFRF